MAYSEYRGRCVGRIMYFLYYIVPNSDSWARIGSTSTRRNETLVCDAWNNEAVVAAVTWKWNTDIPEFKWEGRKEDWNNDPYVKRQYEDAIRFSEESAKFRGKDNNDWRTFTGSPPKWMLEMRFPENCPRCPLEDMSGINFSLELKAFTNNMKNMMELKSQVKEWFDRYHGSGFGCIPNNIYDEAKHVISVMESADLP